MSRTTLCWWCGQPLDFRTVEGIVRPIHPKRTPCPGRTAGLQLCLPLMPQLFVPAFETPVTQGQCWCSSKSRILTVEHTFGLTRFDRLESPWRRHVCDQTVNPDFGFDHLWRELVGEQHQHVSLALVAGTRQMYGARPLIYVAVLECANPAKRHRLEVRCDMATPSATGFDRQVREV